VSQRTLEPAAGVAPEHETGPSNAAAGSWGARLSARRHPWWAVALGVLVISIALVEWAGTRPGFDPYGWMVWGHQTLHLSLDTNAAPSWKPLPYVFTVPFALAGLDELLLWMIFSAAVALSGVVFAARIVYKLTDAAPERRWAGIVAGAFAGAAVLGIINYFHYILSSQSDPMIVSLCLGAICLHLEDRPRAAFILGALAALGRPEVWPFLGLYSLWAWRARPGSRSLLVGGWVAIALLWFGIPAITSRTPFVSAANAMDSGRRLTHNQIFGTVGRFLSINEFPIELAALLAVVLALWRRRSRSDWTILALAAGTVAWVVIEIGFALHGWPGLVRYMFEAGGVVVVLAGVAVGRLLADPRPLSFLRGSLGLWAGPVLVAVLIVGLIPSAITRARSEHVDLKQQRLRTTEINLLRPTIDRLGGVARIRTCGEPLTRLEYQTMLAYTLGLNVSRIGFKYSQALAHGNPVVFYTPGSHGWLIQAAHQTSSYCRSLPQVPGS
jgi:hypothetical protein